MDGCPSGRRCLTRNQVYGDVPWVRIPPHPPLILTKGLRGTVKVDDASFILIVFFDITNQRNNKINNEEHVL